jgi:ATP-grasp domain
LADDRMFGALVTLGPKARLTPLTDLDADKLIGPSVSGNQAALRDLLLRVSRLAEDLPEVTDLDLHPVIVSAEGVAVVNARIKVTPYEPQDPFLRKLR